MRICIVTSSFPRFKGDYAGQNVYNQAVELSRTYEVHVIYPTDQSSPAAGGDQFFHHPFPYPFRTYPMAQVRGLDNLNTVRLFARMSAVIRRVKKNSSIDLFYAFWSIPSAFICSLACGSTPYIVGLMGSDQKVYGLGRAAQPLIKRGVSHAVKVVALSRELKLDTMNMGVEEERIAIIPSGVDMNRYKPGDKAALRAELGLTPTRAVLFVGSLFKLKRVDWLVRLSADLGKKYEFQTVIIGDGPERGMLQDLAAQLDARNVRFLGRLPYDEVPKYMAASDLLVLFSETEGLPSCVQEAMASGTPVMATNVGGVSDIVTNGVTGYVIESESDAREHLSHLFQSPELLIEMGKNARGFACRHLDIKLVTEQVRAVCEAAVDASGKPASFGRTALDGSLEALRAEKPSIGLMSTFRANFLSFMIDVQSCGAGSMHVVAPALNREDVSFYPLKYEIGNNAVSQAWNQITSQLRMSYWTIRLRHKVDFWIFVGCDVFLLPVLTAKILGTPVMLSMQGNLEQEAMLKRNVLNPIQLVMRRINFALADRMLLFSGGLKEKWHLEKYRSKLIVAQSQFIDLDHFCISKPLSDRRRLVGYVGRLSPEKGVWNMVKSMSLVAEQDPDVEFVIIGDGPLHGRIADFIGRSRLNGRVLLTGRVPHEEVAGNMNELRLMVMPSYTEGLPGTLIEAMACGTPVLATPVGAVDDIVVDGRTGFLLDGNSPEEIAKRIVMALDDPDIEGVASRAREHVESEYSLTAVQRRYESVISEGRRLSTSRKLAVSTGGR